MAMQRVDTLNTYLELGATANAVGQIDLADQMFKAALAEAEGDSKTDLRICSLFMSIAASHIDNGQYRKAEGMYKRALQTYANVLGWNNWNCSVVLVHLAELCCMQDKFGQAVQFYRRALKAAAISKSKDISQVSKWYKRVAWINFQRKRLTEASDDYERGVQLSLLSESDNSASNP